MALCWGVFREGTVPLLGFWRFAQHFPHFQSLLLLPIWNWHPSSCCPGAESQSGWVCTRSKTVRPFKWSLLKIQQFLPLSQSPLVFTARSYGDSSSQCWNSGLCSLAWGWNRLLPRYPSRFFSTTHECGTTFPLPPPPLCATLHLLTSLPVSAPPTCLGWM